MSPSGSSQLIKVFDDDLRSSSRRGRTGRHHRLSVTAAPRGATPIQISGAGASKPLYSIGVGMQHRHILFVVAIFGTRIRTLGRTSQSHRRRRCHNGTTVSCSKPCRQSALQHHYGRSWCLIKPDFCNVDIDVPWDLVVFWDLAVGQSEGRSPSRQTLPHQ